MKPLREIYKYILYKAEVFKMGGRPPQMAPNSFTGGEKMTFDISLVIKRKGNECGTFFWS